MIVAVYQTIRSDPEVGQEWFFRGVKKSLREIVISFSGPEIFNTLDNH